MSNPDKEFPGADHNLILLLIKILPYLLGAGVLLRIGFLLVDYFKIKKSESIFPVFVLLVIVLLFLKFDKGWNLALLIGFLLTSGLLLGSLDSDLFQNRAIVIFVVLCMLTWIGAGFLKWEFSISPILVLFLCILYILGWFWIVISTQQNLVFITWIVFGILLNCFVLVGILNRAKNQLSEVEVMPLAIDLILLYINLFWFSTYLF